MKRWKKAALGVAGVGAGAAALYGVNFLYRLAAARKSPKLRAVTETADRLGSSRSEFDEVIAAGQQWLENTPHEDLYITSFDGLKLVGHLYVRPDAKRTILMMHGFRSSWKHDFSGAARDMHELGCNLLLAEQRAHGASEGRHITYGVLERFDCVQWLELLSRRFPALPLYADGISMGATTVLMASGLNMPENVRGIIADCGFTSPCAIMASVLRQHSKVPPELLLPEVSLYSRLAGGCGFSDYSTLDAMAVNTRPVFFAHGEADDFVPPEMTIANYEACKAPKTLLTVPGAGHGMSYLVEHERYVNELLKFFASCEA